MRTYQTLLNLNVDHWDMLAGEHVPTEFDCGNYDLEALAEMLVPSGVTEYTRLTRYLLRRYRSVLVVS